jgi:hypothetical protein
MYKKLFFFILILFSSVNIYARNWKAKHVFIIGLDGWGSYSVEKADMPNVKF